MKRNEMVSLLTSLINEQLYQDYYLDEDIVSNILQKIEESGMLPPFNKVAKVPFNTYDAILEAVSEDFSWEEE